MKLATEADRIAASAVAAVKRGEPVPPWETLRDCCDLATYGDLPPSLLDRLADMVERRVRKAAQMPANQ